MPVHVLKTEISKALGSSISISVNTGLPRISAGVWRAQPAEERTKILNQVALQARDGFSYLYACYPMIQSYLKGLDPDWPLHAMTEFLNTYEVLKFVKDITGEQSCNKLDCQATLYSNGHFLNTHYDTGDTADRRIAYVMSFTKNGPQIGAGSF